MNINDIFVKMSDLEKTLISTILALRDDILSKLSKTDVVGYNPHGEKSRVFDEEICELLIESILDKGFDGFVVTEEKIVEGKTEEAIFLDPIDGSLNVARGINIYALELCYAEKPDLESLSYGLIWDIPNGYYYIGLSNRGAYRFDLETKEIRVLKAQRKDFEDTLIEIGNTKGKAFDMVKKIGTIRELGSIAYAIAKIAQGEIDGLFDNSRKLKFTDIAAGLVILKETGAHYYVEVDGDLLKNPRVKIIASCDKELFNELLEVHKEANRNSR